MPTVPRHSSEPRRPRRPLAAVEWLAVTGVCTALIFGASSGTAHALRVAIPLGVLTGSAYWLCAHVARGLLEEA